MLRHAPASGYSYPEETRCHVPATGGHTGSLVPLLWGDISNDGLVHAPALQCRCAVCSNTQARGQKIVSYVPLNPCTPLFPHHVPCLGP